MVALPAAGLALAGLLLAGVLLSSPAGAGPSGATPEPLLGTADLSMTLMGSSPLDSPSEAWGYRVLPGDVPPPVVNGAPLAFGPVTGAGSLNQLVFERYTPATGWQAYSTPRNADGTPYRGFVPNALSARTTPDGGGVLVGRDPTLPSTNQVVVLDQNHDSSFTVLPSPPASVLLPADSANPAESLAADNGDGAVVDAADIEDGDTALYFAPQGRAVQNAVIHWDGEQWTREPVHVPSASSASFKILAIGATSTSNAWLLAQEDPSTGTGIALFQRVDDSTGIHWVSRPLGSPVFDNVATPADGVSGVAALSGSADSLTVTTLGAWIDGSLTDSGSPYDFTLYYDIAAGKLTGSWCDAPSGGGGSICDHPFGQGFSHVAGYRSFAWPGPGFGTRIITDPVIPGESDSSNNGSYLYFDGASFQRMPGVGPGGRRDGAFSSPTEGWLAGPVHVTQTPDATGSLTPFPLSQRAPLTAIAQAPSTTPGDPSAEALAVGSDGAVQRYVPGRGWTQEFLLTASGSVSLPTLRGVAWPEPGRAYAVGDLGAMWLWQASTGLWEPDPAKPLGVFDANLMGVAFDASNPERGYAVGKQGVLLSYDKSWTQEPLPAGFGDANFTSIAFAGDQALVAAGSDVLENDGPGDSWHVDAQLHQLLATLPQQPQIVSVGGLPDGGAVAAGTDVVLERDGPSSPWRFADQPLPGSTVIAAAPFRVGSRVQAVVSVVPQLRYPIPDVIPPTAPGSPAALIPPFPLPGDGYLLRETSTGWQDEQHASYISNATDKPLKADPILALDLGSNGYGWVVGGWSGEPDATGRGDDDAGSIGQANRARVQTATTETYAATGGTPVAGDSASQLSLPAGLVRFAVGGHATCEGPCADLADDGIGPDETLTNTLSNVAALSQQPNGPRFLLYTGGRLPAGSTAAGSAEENRFAELMSSGGSLPVYAAVSVGDSSGGTAAAFSSAFSSFPSPFGGGGAPGGITPQGNAGGSGGALTHYAFDSSGPGGTVRVIVIDNSAGSLAASDPYQNPRGQQLPWLISELADTKSRGIPSVVVGSRDLNTHFLPALNVASDGDQVAQVLVQGGASAYFFERPEENRSYPVPAGAAQTIPSFGTGSLGYRSAISGSTSGPDSLFGGAGYLLAEVNAAQRNPTTNRAPVNVRFIPEITNLSLDPVDGTLVRRSIPALFQGLGRRPIGGDRWGPVNGDDPDPSGGDPYVPFPPDLCQEAGCSTRITPEYTFTSSATDIGNFVEQDPNSSNLRKPLIGSNDKVIADSSSGLFCPYNAGTTTVTISAGGLSYSTLVTVLGGSVQRPCGTVPLSPSHFKRPAPSASPPPVTPTAAPSPVPPVNLPPIPAVPVAAAPVPLPLPAPLPAPPPVPLAAVLVPQLLPQPLVLPPVPAIVPPGTPPVARPIPPSGAVARVYEVEREEEEEAAPEQSQAFSRYDPDQNAPIEPYLIGVLVLAAFAGASLRAGLRGRGGRPQPAFTDSRHTPQPRSTRGACR